MQLALAERFGQGLCFSASLRVTSPNPVRKWDWRQSSMTVASEMLLAYGSYDITKLSKLKNQFKR